VTPLRHAARGRVTTAAVAALAAGLATGALAGCTVGSGSGSATGSLWVLSCDNGSSYGTQAAPEAFDLSPTFFAGEPLEDLSMGPTHRNQLILRMQRLGLAIQYNDTLSFYVENSYEVARCLRGRTVGGVNDWKQIEPLFDQTPTDWCDWSGYSFTDGGAIDGGIDAGIPDAGTPLDGGMSVMAQYPKIHVTPDTDLRSSLALFSTCPMGGVTLEASGGWIQFMNFGAAEQSDLAPEMRTEMPTDFVINYGDRLRANFHLDLQDPLVINAVEHNMPALDPQLAGTLDGYFDFNLERGRAGQAFP
jgi:hypothetical protein